MSHFSAKTLSFYGIAIGSVLLLFKTVSTYGETKLNAAPNINGIYQFAPIANLPDCLQGKKLNLQIDQSGVYLFGHLEVASPGVSPGVYDDRAVQPEAASAKVVEIPLSGDFKDNQVIMSGKGKMAGCDAGLQLAIQGQREQQNLVGQIKDTAAQTEGAFVAKYQEPKAEAVEGH
ncbi:MAG: hypothetical protein RLZZ04_2573 [Cyanobacteriota bacterium]|jgi:hypothetical protein